MNKIIVGIYLAIFVCIGLVLGITGTLLVLWMLQRFDSEGCEE